MLTSQKFNTQPVTPVSKTSLIPCQVASAVELFVSRDVNMIGSVALPLALSEPPPARLLTENAESSANSMVVPGSMVSVTPAGTITSPSSAWT